MCEELVFSAAQTLHISILANLESEKMLTAQVQMLTAGSLNEEILENLHRNRGCDVAVHLHRSPISSYSPSVRAHPSSLPFIFQPHPRW